MERALINIDYTNDFVADEGALTCGVPGQIIEPYVVDLTEGFLRSEDYIVFAIDVHEPNDPAHPETKLFPPHNIRGTEGRALYGRLQDVFEESQEKHNVYFIAG